jgi:hypothetical protein
MSVLVVAVLLATFHHLVWGGEIMAAALALLRGILKR